MLGTVSIINDKKVINKINEHFNICKTDIYIYDAIHAYIPLSRFCSTIIDSMEFQRLRNLKQLGLC